MPDVIAALARKWCQSCANERLVSWPTSSHSHEAIAAAIREALVEAEKIALEGDSTDPSQGTAARLAALREAQEDSP